MRIVYLIRTFPRLSESFVAREVAELLRQGADLQVWSMRPPDPHEPSPQEALPALAVRRIIPGGLTGACALAASTLAVLGGRPRRALGALAWAARWSLHDRDPRHLAAFPFAAYVVRRIPADGHVHAHFASTMATTAACVARLGDHSWSFSGHARDLWAVTSPAFLADKARRAAFVAVGTQHGADVVRAATAGGREGRVVIVRTGLAAEEGGGRPREARLVASVARLVPKKGLATLVAAVGTLVEQGVDVRCEIIGGGPQEAELRALVARLGLDGVITLHGPRGRSEVRALLERATVFALPCREGDRGDTDNLPLAVIEAMQAGLPVISTPVAGIPEAVRDRHSGLLVPPDDPAALGAALVRLLDDPDLCERLAGGARAIVASEYDLRRTVALLLSEFHRAVAEPRVTGG